MTNNFTNNFASINAEIQGAFTSKNYFIDFERF